MHDDVEADPAGPGVDARRAPGGLGELRDNGQAEPEPFSAGSRRAPEPLERMGSLLVGHACALVDDMDVESLAKSEPRGS